MLSISALWAHDVEIDGIYYDLDEIKKTAEVTYRGNYDAEYSNEYSGSVAIPETITYNSEIYSVTSIAKTAFTYCSELTEITIPSSVTDIEAIAFLSCYDLTKILVSSNNEKYSSENGVLYNEDKTILIKYPEGKNDKSCTIPNSVTSIVDYAFYNCSVLTSVTIPNSVTSIGDYAFSYCSSLTEIIVSSNNEKFSSDNGVLFNKDKTILIKYPEGNKNSKYTIPNSVTSIGEDAFKNCKGLTTVTIGENVESIGEYAFSYCIGLTSITIPNSVTSIGLGAFYDCSGLIEVTIPNSITSIDFGTFYNCSSLTEITIPNSITSIGSSAFWGCSELTEVTIPNSITSIDFGTFYNCSSLTEITIPNSVSSVGSSAFSGCSGLTDVVIPNSVTSIENNAFYDTGIYNNESNWDNGVLYIDNCLIEAKNDLVNGSYIIIDGTRLIADDAFSGCSVLTSVTIPNSVTSIGDYAFSHCSSLTEIIVSSNNEKFSSDNGVLFNKDKTILIKYPEGKNDKSCTIPNSVTSIVDYAFYNCSGLTSITIPNSIISIGSSAFSGCQNLNTVYNYSLLEIVKGSSDNGYVAYYAEEVINASVIGDLIVDDHGVIIKYIGDANIEEIIIPEYIKGIDEGVFSECSKIKKVISYPTIVPIAYNNSFANYNAYLYVPCDVFEDYDLDYVFGSFKYIKCLAAEEVDAPEKVEIEVDEDNNASVIWPSTDGANSYELVISKDGEVSCTLIFNANGQLASIDFGKRSASVGFQFTVTGLDGASKYKYQMTAIDKKGNEIISYKGVFATNGYEGSLDEEDVPTDVVETLADANITISDGLITCQDTEFTIYNTLGQDVTAYNGSLQPGVYVVSVADDVVKVMMK